jgi:hypothetical protein
MGNISQSQRKNAIKAHAKYWEIEQAEELKRKLNTRVRQLILAGFNYDSENDIYKRGTCVFDKEMIVSTPVKIWREKIKNLNK